MEDKSNYGEKFSIWGMIKQSYRELKTNTSLIFKCTGGSFIFLLILGILSFNSGLYNVETTISVAIIAFCCIVIYILFVLQVIYYLLHRKLTNQKTVSFRQTLFSKGFFRLLAYAFLYLLAFGLFTVASEFICGLIGGVLSEVGTYVLQFFFALFWFFLYPAVVDEQPNPVITSFKYAYRNIWRTFVTRVVYCICSILPAVVSVLVIALLYVAFFSINSPLSGGIGNLLFGILFLLTPVYFFFLLAAVIFIEVLFCLVSANIYLHIKKNEEEQEKSKLQAGENK